MTRKTSLSCSSLLLAAGLSVACLSGTSMGETPRRADLSPAELRQMLRHRDLSNYTVVEDPTGENQTDRAVTCSSYAATVPGVQPQNCVGLYGTAANIVNAMVISDTIAQVDVTGAGDIEQLGIFNADNFTVAANGVVDGLCFWGIYANDVAQTYNGPPSAATQAFRVRYYNDGGGIPCGTPILEFIAGAGGIVPITRAPQTITGLGTITNRYTINHPAVNVLANQCYWVEIVDITDSANYFNWMGETLQNGNADNTAAIFRFDNRDQYSVTDLDTSGDLTLCISLNRVVDNCPASAAAPANDAITSATPLSIPTVATPTNNFNATADAGPACGGFAVDADGVWYSVTGNGSALTVSTDGSQCLDTQVIVYDATAFNMTANVADLVCVDGNDDRATGDLDSEVTWCSGSGTPYLIYVAGLNPAFIGTNFIFNGGQAEGNFVIALSSGAACSPADSNPCSVVQQGTDVVESETCGADSNTGCALAQQINVGDTVFGTFFAGSPTFFDQDIDDYAFTLAAAQDIDFTIEAESAAIIAVVDCAGPTLVDAVAIAECVPGPHLRLNLPAGSYSVEITTFSYGGTACASGWESYRMTVVPTPTGACCVGTTCSVTTPTVCNDQNGTWDGNTADCTSTPCAANCVLALGAPAEAEACLTDPTLSSNSAADCSTANALTLGTTSYGTLSTGDGAPAPGTRDIDFWAVTLASASDLEITVEAQSDTIVQLLNCPAGTVVDGFLVDNCTTTATTVAAVPAGSYAVLVTTFDFFGTPCGGGTTNYSVKAALPTPACPPQFETADFDNSGTVSVNDLFAFLAAWFAQNGQVGMGLSADVDGNNAVSVNDLFFFLAAWFAQNGATCP